MTTTRGIALYTGALLGPGLLLLPGLAAAEAGPASVLAWAGLLLVSALFAVVFGALGRSLPSGGGVAGFTSAGLGPRAGAAVRGCFLVGVVCGVPVVCVTGATYLTELTGGDMAVRCLIAMALMLAALGLVSRGLRASSGAQLALVAVLIAMIVIAVAGSAPAARAANWTPFAPGGWTSAGHAASTLMFSFFGWEALAPLTGKFRDPGRQLPRVIGATVLVTTVIYLSLAIATIAVLGRGAATDVPVAALLVRAVGAPGRVIAAVVAVVLTLGTLNAYMFGVVAMSGGDVSGDTAAAGAVADAGAAVGAGDNGAGVGTGAARPRATGRALLAVIGVAGCALTGLYGLGVVTMGDLVGLPVALLLSVYAGCTLSGTRVLRGPARACAMIAFAAVVVLLAFCGWPLVLAAAVALVSALLGVKSRPTPDIPSRPLAASHPLTVSRPLTVSQPPTAAPPAAEECPCPAGTQGIPCAYRKGRA
ncbi:MAG TPA: APC family permease [Trebonia sp.]|jgi:amino acid efflux transporter|nr:APC family permease [Trebonia sp.]